MTFETIINQMGIELLLFAACMFFGIRLIITRDVHILNKKEDPANINARAEIQWLASVAHNNFLDAGRTADWGSHRIEHELSAQYNITHGEGMAIVFTAWTRYIAGIKPWRLALLASRVYGKDPYDYSEKERALLLSEELEKFFKKLGLKTHLSELGITDKDFEVMAERATKGGTVGHYVPLDSQKFIEILKIAI